MKRKILTIATAVAIGIALSASSCRSTAGNCKAVGLAMSTVDQPVDKKPKPGNSSKPESKVKKKCGQ